MVVSFAEIVQSDIFTFYVGEGDDRVERKTYSKAIAATSDTMRALVSGGMRESDTRSAVLEDVLAEDFDRFYEYALRGDYTVPSPALDRNIKEHVNLRSLTYEMPPPAPPPPEEDEVRTPEEEPTVEETPTAADAYELEPEPEPWDEEVMESGPPPAVEGELPMGDVAVATEHEAPSSDRWNFFTTSFRTETERENTNKTSLQKRFDDRTYVTHDNVKDILESGFKTQGNVKSDQDFKPVFLAHARLYTFADMHLVGGLKNLALQKLHNTLMVFKLFYARIGDVIELARYAYDHNLDRKEDGTVDELRELVVEYIAREIDIIGKSKKFERLLQEGGEFVVDFWRIARKYKILA